MIAGPLITVRPVYSLNGLSSVDGQSGSVCQKCGKLTAARNGYADGAVDISRHWAARAGQRWAVANVGLEVDLGKSGPPGGPKSTKIYTVIGHMMLSGAAEVCCSRAAAAGGPRRSGSGRRSTERPPGSQSLSPVTSQIGAYVGARAALSMKVPSWRPLRGDFP